jgi:hypothetical protein
MEVSVHLQAPAALLLVKKPLVRTELVDMQVWMFGGEENLLPVTRIEPRMLQFVV